jgi:hypothetical protein
MGKYFQAARDYWEAVISFVGAAMTAYSVVTNWTKFGIIPPDWFFNVGLLLFLFFGVLAIIKEIKKRRDLESKNQPVSPSNTTNLKTENPIGSVTAREIHNSPININYNQPAPAARSQTPLSINLRPETITHEESICVIVHAPEQEDIGCRCILDSIERNGIVDEELKRRMTAVSPLVSWSQGTPDGTKPIDSGSHAMLNIATLTINGLTFNMQSGNHTVDMENSGVGKYKLNLTLRGRVGNENFAPISHSVSFNCYRIRSYDERNHPLDRDTVRRDTRIVFVLGSEYDDFDYLYLKIVRD